MARLSLTFLGGFHARFEDGREPILSLRKTQALLAYPPMAAGTSHSRDKIASLLWGDMQELQARRPTIYARPGISGAILEARWHV